MATHHDWKKYIIVFLITAGIFVVAIFLSSSISNKRLERVRMLQDSVATDILSSETRFALLEQTSCTHLVTDDDPILSEELGLYGARVASMERERGSSDLGVQQVKRYYTLLQIKDYLLTQQLDEKCDTDTATVLFFYNEDCPNCERQRYVLDVIREEYQGTLIYDFDYSIELSALRTLASIHGIQDVTMPILVVNGVVYKGYFTLDELRSILVEQGIGIDEDSLDDQDEQKTPEEGVDEE